MTDLFSVFAFSKAEKDSHVSLNKFFIVKGIKFLFGSILLCAVCSFLINSTLTSDFKSNLYNICVLPFVVHPFLSLFYIFAATFFVGINLKNKQDIKCFAVMGTAIFFLFAGLFLIQEITYNTSGPTVGFVFLLISLIAFVTVSFFITYFEKINVYSAYFALMVPLGLIYYFAVLPWSAPDAVRHMAAVYRFSNIALMQDEWSARKIDSDFFENVWVNHKDVTFSGYKDVSDNIKAPVYLEKTDELSIKDADMTCYSFVSYLPLVAGVVFGRLLDLNTLQTAYMAKLCMFIFYVIGVFLAIKTIPKFKYTIAMIALCPMALMSASGIHYDGMVIITTFNFIASVLAFNEKKTRFNFGMVLLWTFLMTSCKGGGYIILLPLVLMSKNYKLIICVLATALLSLLIFNDFLYTDQPMFQFGDREEYLSTDFAFKYPLQYLKMVFNMYIQKFGYIIYTMLGSRIGWLNLKTLIPTIPPIFMVFIFILLILNAANEGCKKNNIIYAFAGFLTLLLACLGIPALLLRETKIGADAVFGIQGRYFLPLLPVFMFLVGSLANGLPHSAQNMVAKINPKFVFVCFVFVSYLCVYCMVASFWRAVV